MFRKFIILFLALTLFWTTGAYGRPEGTTSPARSVINTAVAAPTQSIEDGQYPVQQVTYDDATGEYTLVLLNTRPGTPPIFRSQNLQMARLTDEEIKAGQKSYLKVENKQPVLYLTEDFKIEYVHSVTETQTNPQTGQQETVVVRRENNFWAPFAGAVAGNLAGQAIGSLLFRPQYYVPPVYQPGGSVLRGYGGYGSSYGQAVERYQSRYNAPPLAVRNRQSNFRTTGRIRTPSYSQPTTRRTTGRFRTPVYSQPTRRVTPRYNSGNRSTGSGYGTSTLRSSGRSNPSYRQPSSRGFGSSGSFGSSRNRVGSRRRWCCLDYAVLLSEPTYGVATL